MVINKLQKNGNSWYLSIPKNYLLKIGIKAKEYVCIKLLTEGILISPIESKIKKNEKGE